MAKRPRRPRDPNQLAKLIVDISTGQIQPQDPDEGKNIHAVSLGRLGGLKGGPARTAKLSKQERVKAARLAAHARWRKKK